MLNEIFADCERKNLCISRYCEDPITVEKSDYCMIWIYIHIKEFDKAKKLIDRLPSLESNNLRETIMTQYIHFQYGFEKEKEYISENVSKLLNVTAKEFFFSLEDYAWFGSGEEAILFSEKIFGVISAYKAFDNLRAIALAQENLLRRFMPRCYAKMGDIDKAVAELIAIAKNYAEIVAIGKQYKDIEEAKADAYADINKAIDMTEEKYRELMRNNAGYKEAVDIIENI